MLFLEFDHSLKMKYIKLCIPVVKQFMFFVTTLFYIIILVLVFMFFMECIFPFGCGVFAKGKQLNNRCFDILEFFMLFKVSVG